MSIIGPGGVGGIVAGALFQASIPVQVVARPSTASIIAERGLRVRSAQFGEFTAKIPAVTEPSPGSAIIIATKAYSLPEIAESVAAAKPTQVIALCNGVAHIEQVAAMDPTAACGSIRIFAERTEPGVIVQHTPQSLIVIPEAAWDGPVARSLIAAGFNVAKGGTEEQVLWEKLSMLSPLALLTAGTGSTIGQALSAESEFAEGLVAEVAALAARSGANVSAESVMSLLRSLEPDSTSSLARDVAAGNRTELAALGSQVADLAEKAGLAHDYLSAAVARVADRIEGER